MFSEFALRLTAMCLGKLHRTCLLPTRWSSWGCGLAVAPVLGSVGSGDISMSLYLQLLTNPAAHGCCTWGTTNVFLGDSSCCSGPETGLWLGGHVPVRHAPEQPELQNGAGETMTQLSTLWSLRPW